MKEITMEAVMTFEEWWEQRKPRPDEFIAGDLITLAASAAWNYQKDRIDDLEAKYHELLYQVQTKNKSAQNTDVNK